MRWRVERRFPGATLITTLLMVGAFPESALSQTASSADAPPSGPAISWAGAFAGGQVVGSLSTVATSEFTAATGAVFHHFDSFAGGAGGGVDFGYNWLPSQNNWLVGVVADINFLSDSGGRVFTTMDQLTGSGQVRVGFLAAPGLLCYGQTGLAIAKESLKVDFGGPITEQGRVIPGYAIGAGAEWALPIAPPAPLAAAPSLFVEYQHVWWGSSTLNMPAAVPSLNFAWQRESNTIKAGLRIHF
jgi:opacity protein-like surface antigen